MTSHPHLAHFFNVLGFVVVCTVLAVLTLAALAAMLAAIYDIWWDKQSHWKWLHDKLEAWWHWIYWKKLATNLERWREIPHEESEYWRNFRRDKDIESCPTAKTMRIDR